MKTAIIIHGYNDKSEYEDASRPAASNDHWIPCIQRQLFLKGIEAQTPELPGLYEPNYDVWKQMFERFTPDEETLLIGHSCGGGFLVRWLSENEVKVGKVILVAPWIDPRKNIVPEFFDFEIDSKLAQKTKQFIVMYSTDDYPDILKTVEIIKSKVDHAIFKEFEGKGHFTLQTLKTEKFPELLEEAVRDSLNHIL